MSARVWPPERRTAGALTPRGFLVSNSIIVALEEALAVQKIRREQALAQRDYRII